MLRMGDGKKCVFWRTGVLLRSPMETAHILIRANIPCPFYSTQLFSELSVVAILVVAGDFCRMFVWLVSPPARDCLASPLCLGEEDTGIVFPWWRSLTQLSEVSSEADYSLGVVTAATLQCTSVVVPSELRWRQKAHVKRWREITADHWLVKENYRLIMVRECLR